MNIKKIVHNATSWKDLNKTLESFTKSNRSKLAGDIFEYLTKLYLETAPHYKSKLRKIYLLNEVPNNIKKKLNLPNTDEGIDLIAETFDKEYWAIQCKYRSNPNETLTVKGDLSTFNNLAFTYCKNITHAIVCATVNKPPKKIKLLKSIGFETLETWLALDDGDLFTQIKAKTVGKVYKPTILKPRTHQVAAIKKTIEHFKSNERGKIIMPCGTGKSLTAFWIAKQMGVKSILVAVPSLALLQQTLKVWTREFLINGIEPEWFCVCSDGTVKDEQDDYVTDTADLGIKVDTDPSLIKQFLKKKTSKIKVVFTTYQSGRATAKGSKGFTYDLGIMDEAHKTVGSKTKEMAHLLHQKNVRIKKRIFMTATERLFRGDSDEFMSMDDPRDYGDLMYELSFKEAINSKPPIISDYKIITFGITTPEIEEIYQSNKYLEVKKILKDITAREFATAIALRKAIKKLKIKNAISFHRSIRRADNFRVQQDLITKIFPSYGKLKSFHVRGDMPTSDRAIQMRNFAEGEGLMTNARCLTEGVDLPAIDCVVFTDPKRSKVDIVQAAGRALRLSKDKKFGYILIPIFIPDGADFNEAAEEQGFDDVAVTVRALATTDTRITEYLRVISEGKKPKGGSPVDGLTSVNSLYKVEAEEFDKAIKLKVWDKVAVVNYRNYLDAKKYALSLKLKNSNEWKVLKRKRLIPKDIPHTPDGVYKEWKSWGDLLGTGNVSYRGKKTATYQEVKNYARKLNLKNASQWFKHTKSKNFPTDIPSMVYRYREFEGFGEFLGTKNKSFVGKNKQNYLNYKQTKRFAQKLKLKSMNEWFKYFKKNKLPNNIILYPNQKFKEFEGWGVFLGNGNIRSQDIIFLEYETAKKKLESFKFTSQNEFRRAAFKNAIPKGVPKAPHIVYGKKFKGYDDFLSNPYAKRIKYRSYKLSKKFAQSLKLKKASEWKKLIIDQKLPIDIPKAPQNVYKEFEGWGVFLDSGNRVGYRNQIYLDFNDVKKYARTKKIKNRNEWFEHCQKKLNPLNIPQSVDIIYKDRGWKNWDDFLGTSKFIPFNEAKKYASSLAINGWNQWNKYFKKNKRPNGIPAKPFNTYKNEWKGWPDFLGKKK
ncbi:DEAD/DEAH box helicase family protein [Candidatus Pelagibacter ubique]|nr:DEAD/DEAH box helicase family protein [Candidatus Pelagibacter ubique]